MNEKIGLLGFGDGLLRQPAMRLRFFQLVVLLVLFGLASGGTRVVVRNDSQDIAMKPLALDPERPTLRKVGELEFLAAWELGSDNPDFGGISALAMMRDGRFIGVSDTGTLIGFGLTGKNQTDRPFIAPLPDAHGKNIGYADRDSESIAHDPATGRFWISYEGKHAIRRFGRSFSRTEAIARPKAMQSWGDNSGAEALIRLPGGQFIVFSEGYDLPDGSYEALHFSGDPTEEGSSSFSFGYAPPAGHKITDAAMLPDGRILTLNRKLSFPPAFSIALAVFDPAQISKGAVISPKVIARLQAPLLVDNMEGLVVAQEGGRTIIWMISDNNFNIWQRSILMKFALAPAKPLAQPKEQQKAAGTKKPEADTAPGFEAL